MIFILKPESTSLMVTGIAEESDEGWDAPDKEFK